MDGTRFYRVITPRSRYKQLRKKKEKKNTDRTLDINEVSHLLSIK